MVSNFSKSSQAGKNIGHTCALLWLFIHPFIHSVITIFFVVICSINVEFGAENTVLNFEHHANPLQVTLAIYLWKEYTYVGSEDGAFEVVFYTVWFLCIPHCTHIQVLKANLLCLIISTVEWCNGLDVGLVMGSSPSCGENTGSGGPAWPSE